MKYVVATVAGLAILFVYAIIGAGLGWQNAGGAIPQVLLWSAIVGSWIAIIKNWPAGSGDGGTRRIAPSPRPLGAGMTGGQVARTVGAVSNEPPPVPVLPPQEMSQSGSSPSAVIDDVVRAAYTEAWAECEEGRQDKGLWARAFADANGDESKTKAAYLRMRVGEKAVVSPCTGNLVPAPSAGSAVVLWAGRMFGSGDTPSNKKFQSLATFCYEYRRRYRQFKNLGDQTLYSIVAKAYPDVPNSIEGTPAPRFTDWPGFIAAYKAWHPETAATPDVDLANQLRALFPVLRGFDAQVGHWYSGR